MRIQAAVASPDGGDYVIKDADLESPRDDEILVRIMAAGLCHTDVVAQAGSFMFGAPAVLGHEGAGIVEQVGAAVKSIVPGDRVTISFRSCGDCQKCSAGHPAYCSTMPLLNYIGKRTDGSRALSCEGEELASNFFGQSSFATHALTYERNVVKIGDDIPFAIAAPLGCGVQTGAGSVIKVFGCEAGSSLLVTGGGAVGLSAVMAGRIRGCDTIILVEPFPARRDLAFELGATHVIDPLAVSSLAEAIREILPLGVDYALDTTGRDDVLAAIMTALAPQGSLGCVGIVAPGTKPPGELGNLMTFGHRIIGIIEGDSEPETFIPELIAHYRAGRLPVDRLITKYPLAAINQAVADQHDGRCVKVVLTLD